MSLCGVHIYPFGKVACHHSHFTNLQQTTNTVGSYHDPALAKKRFPKFGHKPERGHRGTDVANLDLHLFSFIEFELANLNARHIQLTFWNRTIFLCVQLPRQLANYPLVFVTRDLRARGDAP